MDRKCNMHKASPAKGLCVFIEKMEQDFLTKNTKNWFRQTIIYVLGYNTINWTEIAG